MYLEGLEILFRFANFSFRSVPVFLFRIKLQTHDLQVPHTHINWQVVLF